MSCWEVMPRSAPGPLAPDNAIAYSYSTPFDQAQLHLNRAGDDTALTDFNARILSGKSVAKVERIRFLSFDGREVEAFLTHPIDMDEGSDHPMIVMIHGGPTASRVRPSTRKHRFTQPRDGPL